MTDDRSAEPKRAVPAREVKKGESVAGNDRRAPQPDGPARHMTREAPTPGQRERGAPPPSRGVREAAFTGSSYDPTARTVEAVFSAGSAVTRWFGIEQLEVSADAIDLTRVASNLCPFLNAHNSRDVKDALGRVIAARIEGDLLVGTIAFADTDAGRAAEGQVSRGELTGISIGYDVSTWTLSERTDVSETWTATRWELLEVSLVPVPADRLAGVRSAPHGNTPVTGDDATNEEEEMFVRDLPGGAGTPTPTPAPAPSVSRFAATDAVDFMDQARSFGVETRARELVDQNSRGEIGTEAARAAIMQAAAEAQRAQTGGVRGTPGFGANGQQEEGSRNAIADALAARTLREQPSDAAREFMGMRLLEIAASRAGLSPRERDPITILRAAHTSSDFPMLMESAGNRVLLARYNAAAPTYRDIAARRDLTDFKQTALLRVGDFPTLLPYAEDGEIKAGTIGEGKETVMLGSYGRILRLSRQAIVNDDLGAFDQVFGSIGRMIARFENNTFYAMKAQNGGLGPKMSDGKTLFHKDHGNLLSGADGTDMEIESLGVARAAIRKQKDMDDNILNVAPTRMLVGPTLETRAEQLVAPLQPVLSGDINPFAGRLTPTVDGTIDGKAWELYADPSDLPTFVYGYLADAPGPRVISEETFNVDGMAWRVTEDFYTGAVDYRGAFRNTGKA
ncbi:prohead protease/major capsid protein fusion protein [Sphingomonas sp. Leaf231]|uniref:prohead protease/major capsid protein fusion protein n=1 Tax=Sphingomonas sp. Leaf231 TaxID=1736301 RepID=UPI000AA3B307|nr:prohead protease/major capsid protein fusion protein [Sphingomonas sp. Leaf231]